MSNQTAASLASKITTGPDGTVYGPNGTPAGKAAKTGPARASRNGKAKPSKTKAVKAAPASGSKMGETRLIVARVLSKHPGGTLQDVVKWTKLNDRVAYHHLWHLRKDGYVKSAAADEVGVLFELTAKGKKLVK